MPAGEAKNNFGLLIDDAQRAPVRIEKHGRLVAFKQLVSGQSAAGEGRAA